jgi:hypothetical protein
MKQSHGMTHTPEYQAWRSMKRRCYSPRDKGYADYGGRGITVCPEWLHDFQAFYDHVGPRPTSQHSIDRIDNNEGYRPGNVKWSTQSGQNWNQRKETGTTSVFRGVNFEKANRKWRAQISQHGKRYWLGRFPDPEAAARVYDDASLRMFGARVNFPDDQKAA